MCETPVRPTPPSPNLDDLTSRFSALSLSLDVEKAERQCAELRMARMEEMFSEMVSGMNELRDEVRDMKDQGSYIARLESRNNQLCDEKRQLLLQQRSSGATRLLDRSTASLLSFITPVKPPLPKVDVSREDLGEPIHLNKNGLRGKLRSNKSKRQERIS